MEWSPNGRFLVTTAMDKRVCIWNVDSSSLVSDFNFASPPLLARWQWNRNTLVLGFQNQTLNFVDDVIDDEVISISKPKIDEELGNSIFSNDTHVIAGGSLESTDHKGSRPSTLNVTSYMDVESKLDMDDQNADMHYEDDDLEASDLDDFLVDDENGNNKTRKQQKEELKKRFLQGTYFAT
jgi:WD40 repeat protein